MEDQGKSGASPKQIKSLGFKKDRRFAEPHCFWKKRLACGVVVHMFYSQELRSMSVDCEYPGHRRESQVNRMEIHNFAEMEFVLSRLTRITTLD